MRRVPLLVFVLLFTGLIYGAQNGGQPSQKGSTAPERNDASNAASQGQNSSTNKPGDAVKKNAAEGQDSTYIDPHEPLFAPGPLPKGTISLVGGTVVNVDRIRNRLKIKVTGGDDMTLAFDERSNFFRDGQPVTYEKLQKGDR